MNLLRKCFPYSFGVETLKDLIMTVIAYFLAVLLFGFLLGFLSKIPGVGFVFSLLMFVLDLYCYVGVVLAILRCLKILK